LAALRLHDRADVPLADYQAIDITDKASALSGTARCFMCIEGAMPARPLWLQHLIANTRAAAPPLPQL
jgi:hypothetical protein